MSNQLHVRRRDGGDLVGRLYRRRREGGDQRLYAPGETDETSTDLVTRFFQNRPFYISHRLGGDEYPEFTRRGLDASLRAGFKALELSVRRCGTGEYVLMHDWKTTRTVPGSDYAIWNTPWATLKTLQQASGQIMTLDEVLDNIPKDVILAIDHKTTSSKADASEGDLQSEIDLYTKLDAAFNGRPQERVIWKGFIKGGGARRARARGYKTMCMFYETELADAQFDEWDVLGLEWNASQSAWTMLTSTGKPTIAHIVTNIGQASTAFSKGARGLMCSRPSDIHP